MPLVPETGGDEELVRYLLGLLPEKDAERLDELSVTDEDVAWRLRAVENDLVDAYVRGSLTGETRERFESVYLSSPRRRAKVGFAGALRRVVDRGATPAVDKGDSSARILTLPKHLPPRDPIASARVEGNSKHGWTLAAVAAAMLLASGALLVRESRLRDGLADARREAAALEQRARELQEQLTDQRAANAGMAKDLARIRDSQSAWAKTPGQAGEAPNASPLRTIAIMLLPQTRGVGDAATVALPKGTDRVRCELRLESNDFPRYRPGLRDPAANRIVWRGGWVAPGSSGDRASVIVFVPAGILRPQHYALELSGQRAASQPEIVASYAFRVVTE